jgi:hypothetical protein
MEGSEPDSAGKAQLLIGNYASRFWDLCFTMHPPGRSGEIRGKSSNVAWAANQMVLRSKGHIESCRQVFTVIDADSHFAQDYFDSVSYHYSVALPSERRRMMFVPPTVFDRNADQVPALVRVTDMLWSAGVLSNMYPSSSIKIPCSAYSISMDLSKSVSFWDVGPEAIGEDLHMYLKVFFSTNGQAQVVPIYSPASQCNVQSSQTGLPGWFAGLFVRYSQAKRHLWGSLDTGYAFGRLVEQLLYRTKTQKLHKNDDKKEEPPQAISHAILMIKLFHRLLEAHVFMGHLFFLLATSTLIVPYRRHFPLNHMFGALSIAPLPKVVLISLAIGFWLRLIAIFPTLGTVYYYERYHRWASQDRWMLQRVTRSGRRTDSAVELNSFASLEPHFKGAVQYLGKRGHLISTRSSFYSLFDWAAMPLSGILFYVLPQFHAQICHLWTTSLDYQVAAKPRLDIPLSEVLSCPLDPSCLRED